MHNLIHFHGIYSQDEEQLISESIDRFETQRHPVAPELDIGKPWVVNCQQLRSSKIYIAHRLGALHPITARSLPEFTRRIADLS